MGNTAPKRRLSPERSDEEAFRRQARRKVQATMALLPNLGSLNALVLTKAIYLRGTLSARLWQGVDSCLAAARRGIQQQVEYHALLCELTDRLRRSTSRQEHEPICRQWAAAHHYDIGRQIGPARAPSRIAQIEEPVSPRTQAMPGLVPAAPLAHAQPATPAPPNQDHRVDTLSPLVAPRTMAASLEPLSPLPVLPLAALQYDAPRGHFADSPEPPWAKAAHGPAPHPLWDGSDVPL